MDNTETIEQTSDGKVTLERRKVITFNFELRKTSTGYPVFLRITEDGRHLRYKSDVTLSRKSDWDQSRQKIRYTEPNRDDWQNNLDQLMEKAKGIHRRLQEESSPDRIIEELRGGDRSDSFLEFAERYRDRFKNEGKLSSYRKYNQVCRKFSAYMESRRRDPYHVKFKEIDYSFVSDFEAFMKTLDNKQYMSSVKVDGKNVKPDQSTPGSPRLHQNYIAKILNYFRTLLNKAADEKLIHREDNPFNTYKIRKEETQREELTLEEIQRIIALDLPEGSREWHSRNFFLFAMYCAGVRIGDLLCLRWRNITTDGRLRYQMEKNHKIQDIPLLPLAVEILELYRRDDADPNSYIFPYMRTGKYKDKWERIMSDRELDSMDGQDKLKYKETISSKESMVNNGLRTIRTMAGLTKPLSTHIARHSFARLAKEVHTDNSLVQGLLLHSSISTTERYMGRFSTDARDEALREIFKPLAPEMVHKRDLLKQLAELPEEDLAAMLEEYRRKKAGKGSKTI